VGCWRIATVAPVAAATELFNGSAPLLISDATCEEGTLTYFMSTL